MDSKKLLEIAIKKGGFDKDRSSRIDDLYISVPRDIAALERLENMVNLDGNGSGAGFHYWKLKGR